MLKFKVIGILASLLGILERQKEMSANPQFIKERLLLGDVTTYNANRDYVYLEENFLGGTLKCKGPY